MQTALLLFMISVMTDLLIPPPSYILVAIGSDVGVRVMCCCAAADSRATADTASSHVDGA